MTFVTVVLVFLLAPQPVVVGQWMGEDAVQKCRTTHIQMVMSGLPPHAVACALAGLAV